MRVIWLLRHGEAEDASGDDAARELTGKGEKQARRAGAALVTLGAGIEVCLTSPKVRALDTARIACEALGVEPEIDERLRAGFFDPIEVAAGRGEVLLVGHEPDFSGAIVELTGGRVKLKKGGLAACEVGILHGLYSPRDLKQLG